MHLRGPLVHQEAVDRVHIPATSRRPARCNGWFHLERVVHMSTKMLSLVAVMAAVLAVVEGGARCQAVPGAGSLVGARERPAASALASAGQGGERTLATGGVEACADHDYDPFAPVQ